MWLWESRLSGTTTFTTYQSVRSHQFAVSLLVEFIGVTLFSFLGSTVKDPILGPIVNGLALAVLIYTAANISGGHLNPAVTISTLLCGFYPLIHSILYICLQVAGGIVGSLLAAGLLPATRVGMGAAGPGCFEPPIDEVSVQGLTRGQLFGWEVVMTFTLISVVYACGIAKPGHGRRVGGRDSLLFTPLVVGLTLTACAGTGGRWTGAALNPARVAGPAVVFRCSAGYWWMYILAEGLAALLACCVFAFVSGWGPLSPVASRSKYRLTSAEAARLWVTGSPPPRLRGREGDNMEDVVERLERDNDAKASAAQDIAASPAGAGP
ncbi:MAG: aquaporin-like protein [Monoraphidium minutum]|nr:MAG: aquaporin-like protein [Monoraphidium minutum]